MQPRIGAGTKQGSPFASGPLPAQLSLVARCKRLGRSLPCAESVFRPEIPETRASTPAKGKAIWTSKNFLVHNVQLTSPPVNPHPKRVQFGLLLWSQSQFDYEGVKRKICELPSREMRDFQYVVSIASRSIGGNRKQRTGEV